MSKIIENYVLLESLGEDSYGFDVFKARHIHTNELFTIYGINKAVFDSPNFFKGAVDNQIDICKKLNHPNLLRFVKLIKTAHNSYSIWDYCDGGTLYDRVLKDKQLDNPKIMKQLAAGVRQMHKYHIIHMNLHPQNVQLTGSDTVKISNFSNSRCLGDAAETKNYDVKNIKLTELLAPELLQGRPATLKSDIYSLGKVFGFLKYRSFSFDEELAMGLKLRDPEAEIIFKMLRPEPNQRISAENLVVSLASCYKHIPSLSSKSVKNISALGFVKSSQSQQSNSSKYKLRACTPTSAGCQRDNSAKDFKLKAMNTSKDSVSTSKLGTLAAQRREREKDASTESKSIAQGGDLEEKLLRSNVRKVLRERNKYYFLLYVAQETSKMNLHKVASNLMFLLVKKAFIQLKNVNAHFKTKEGAQNQELAEFKSTIDKEVSQIKDYYRICCHQQLQHQTKPTPQFARQLQQQVVISQSYMHRLTKQYVTSVLSKINSELKSRSMRSLQAGPQKNMLIHLLNVLYTQQLDNFSDLFLNQTLLKMQDQVYFKEIQQMTLLELSSIVNKKVA